AAEIIGKLKLQSLQPQLVSLALAPTTESPARTAIAQAQVMLHPDARAAALAAALTDPLVPDELRPKIGLAIAERGDGLLIEALREVMKRVPMRLQTTIAETLAGDAAGAGALLSIIENGQASPRLLLAPNVSSKLGTLKNADLNQRVTAITAKLPPADAILDALLVERRRAFARVTTNIERGQ